MNRFVFICPTYNAEKTARQAILSIAAQSYTNWQIIIVDDMSTDDTARTILQLASALGIGEKVKYIFNKEKKWEVANVIEGLKFCKDDDIVCRMDMDDFLLDNQILQLLNTIYTNNPDLDVVWTAHRWFDDDQISTMNISKELPAGADPYTYPWVSSHFKTFRKKLLNSVSDENFRGEDGQYFKRIGDQAFMLPALYNAKRWAFLSIVAYAYRCSLKPETFQTDDAKFQAAEAEFLRKRGYVK